ncbi:acetyl-CoA carboxylase [Billgrantia endophytica]|uniref:Biotin carboxyl carrier protein of acetyl-CoA carboxylase n=1 Tax=Billgrantia endophytica TaxID=2033802 RepID=A0A2N7TX52_9GAMM|nr:acetyl-CoA carboxylase [Halomonas endophytica]PMR72759.1 biotin carboxyl carrier domain-containing protein [Halomonas endophytica]
MTLTHKELVEVLQHLEESSCEEFSLQMEGVDLLLRRKVDGAGVTPRAPQRELPCRHAEPQQAASATASAPAEQAACPPVASAAPAAGHSVAAPMSGIFYRCSSPDAPPFVEEGAEVKVGDPLGMIEVMKLFSTLYAKVPGRVVAIQVADGGSVQQGDVLMVIE